MGNILPISVKNCWGAVSLKARVSAPQALNRNDGPMKNTVFSLMALAFFCLPLAAQESKPQEESAAPRRMAPGVMKTVHPFINYSETYQWADVPTFTSEENQRLYDWAKDLYFSKEVWCLELSFKPLRTMKVDIPNDRGVMDTKEIVYMVYSVTNTGKTLASKVSKEANTDVAVMVHEDGEFKEVRVNIPQNNLEGMYEPDFKDYNGEEADENGVVPGTVRFVPRFVLVGHDISEPHLYQIGDDGFYYQRLQRTPQSPVYNEQFIPLALVQIASYEDPNQKFENSITFPNIDIAPGETYWGIVTWGDVDPKIDDLTVYVSGLTNALRWRDGDEARQPNVPIMTGREIFRKVLKLNFYHPGDENHSTDPYYYGKPGEEKFEWVFM